MDWLFQICVIIWVLCDSGSKSQSIKETGGHCTEGEKVPPLDECNNCVCHAGQIHCSANKCALIKGDKREKQCLDEIIYHPNYCTQCVCHRGILECSNLMCYGGVKCVVGEELPSRDECNTCVCIENYVICSTFPCPKKENIETRKFEAAPVDAQPHPMCADGGGGGEVAPQPQIARSCMHQCPCAAAKNNFVCPFCNTDYSTGIKARFKNQNEQNNFNIYQKQIPIDPFRPETHEKAPIKLLHTPAYNGVLQDIKVHSRHLPKNTDVLLKALAKASMNSPSPPAVNDRIKPNYIQNNNELKKISYDGLDQYNLSPVSIITPKQRRPSSVNYITNGNEDESILVIPSPASTIYKKKPIVSLPKSETRLQEINNGDTHPVMNAVDLDKFIHDIFPKNSSWNTVIITNNTTKPKLTKNPKLSIYVEIHKNEDETQSIDVTGKEEYLPLQNRYNDFSTSEVNDLNQVLSDKDNQRDKPTSIPTVLTYPNIFKGYPKNVPGMVQNRIFQDESEAYTEVTKASESKLLVTKFKQNQNVQKVFSTSPQSTNDIPGYQEPSSNGFNPSNPAEDLTPLKVTPDGSPSKQVQPQSYPNRNQPIPEFADPESANKLPQSPNSAQIPLYPKDKNLPLQSKLSNFPNQPTQGTFYNPEPIDYDPIVTELPYPDDSDKSTPLQIKSRGLPKTSVTSPQPSRIPFQLLQILGFFDEEKTTHTIKSEYSYNHTEVPLKRPQSQFNPSLNEPGSTNGFPYPSTPAEKPTQLTVHSRNPESTLQSLQPQLNPFQKVPASAVLDNPEYEVEEPETEQYLYDPTDDDSVSTNDFPYPTSSAEEPTLLNVKPKQPPYSPSEQPQTQYDPSLNVKPKKSPYSPLEQPKTQFDPSQKLQTPGVFDNPESDIKSRYPSNSAEESQPKYPYKPSFQDPTSTNEFPYPSSSAKDPTKLNVKQKERPYRPSEQPQKQFDPSQKLNGPEVFDNPESDIKSRYPSNLSEEPESQYVNNPSQTQQPTGTSDEPGSANGYPYPSSSAEEPTELNVKPREPSDRPFKQRKPYFDPSQKFNEPEVFDNPESDINSRYPSNLSEEPEPQYVNNPSQAQQPTGTSDEPGSANGYPYPSSSAEEPTELNVRPREPSDRPFKQLKPHIDPSQKLNGPEVFDNPDSDIKSRYPSNLSEEPESQYVTNPTQSQQPTGTSDEPGSPEDPTLLNVKPREPHRPFKQPQSRNDTSQKLHNNPGLVEKPESDIKSRHPSNSDEEPQPQHLFNPTQTQQPKGTFDDSGPVNRHPYPSSSKEPQIDPSQKLHAPGVLDNPESDINSQYPSNSVENPQPQYLYNPSQNQQPSGMLDEPGSTNGLPHPLISTENPKQLTINSRDPELPQSQLKPTEFDELLNSDEHRYPTYHVQKLTNTEINYYATAQSHYSHAVVLPYLGDSSETLTKPEPNEPKLTPVLFPNKEKGNSNPSSIENIQNVPWPLPDNHDDHKKLPTSDTNPSRPEQNQDYATPSRIMAEQNENLPITHPLQPKEIPSDANETQLQPNRQTPIDAINFTSKPQNSSYPSIKDRVNEIPPTDPYDETQDHQFDILPSLLATTAKNPTLLDEEKQLSDESQEIEQRNSLTTPEPSNDDVSVDGNEVVNWLMKNYEKIKSKVSNATLTIKHISGKVTEANIDLPEMIGWLLKLIPPKEKPTISSIQEDMSDPELEKVVIQSKTKEIETTIQYPEVSTQNYGNKPQYFPLPKTYPAIPPDTRYPNFHVRYPDVHIILHQPDGVPREYSGSMLPKVLNPRNKYGSQAECADGSEWTSNCHDCSCYDGQATCTIKTNCILRPFGQPMTCKPYSTFKMGGCYVCTCNGDGVAECSDVDCNEDHAKKESETIPPPAFKTVLEKRVSEMVSFYNEHQKMPKNCPPDYPTCEPGTTWTSSCHQCKCNDNSKHECTKIDDCLLQFENYGKPSRCKPNLKFYPRSTDKPCKECTCDDEGNPYCPE